MRSCVALDAQLAEIARAIPGARRSARSPAFAASLRPHGSRPARRDRRLPPLRKCPRADELPRPHLKRVLLGQAHPARLDHQDGQSPRAPAVGRGGLALPAPAPPLGSHQGAQGLRHSRGVRSCLAGADPPPRPLPPPERTGKRSTVAVVAVARELAGFLWAARPRSRCETSLPGLLAPAPERRASPT